MEAFTENTLVSFAKFSLFMLQFLLVLVFILAGIGLFWGITGNGFEPLSWALKTLLPAACWGVIYFLVRIVIAKTQSN
ncbi:hypothetical protein [Pseudoalteromonas galatheae]|uniref:hypothetical protein n=1 Tax=Pseudoalteromonas galatheae TaxID=579562 RepID=UPI0030D0BA5C